MIALRRAALGLGAIFLIILFAADRQPARGQESSTKAETPAKAEAPAKSEQSTGASAFRPTVAGVRAFASSSTSGTRSMCRVR